MPETTNTLEPIVTAAIGSAAREAIDYTNRNTPFPYLIDAKLGSAQKAPIMDAEAAAEANTPLYTIPIKWKDIVQQLIEADAQCGNALREIARRANTVITRTGILNRHNRRPPLYSESTIDAFIHLGVSTPQHSPMIRAAGHLIPPPIFPLNHDLVPIIKDIAAHMARSHEPQSVAQILASLESRRILLAQWPDLDLALFIHRVADIRPDDQGSYHPDQPWGKFISTQQLVTNNVLRIFARDREPRHTSYLVSETERLVGQFLPEGYNTLIAVRTTIAKSDDIFWQRPSTYGLRNWDNTVEPWNGAARRNNTGDLIYAFLIRHGPAVAETVIEHIRRTTGAKRRTVQNAIIHDPENRFIRISGGRVAANPVPDGHNRASRSLKVVSDQRECEPVTVLRESELTWLTRYVQGLNELEPPLPSRVAITGPRAAGFAHEGDSHEITVVTDQTHWPDLEPRLVETAAAATQAVPSVRPKVRILSTQQWAKKQAGETPIAHHNVWLAPDAASRPSGLAPPME